MSDPEFTNADALLVLLVQTEFYAPEIDARILFEALQYIDMEAAEAVHAEFQERTGITIYGRPRDVRPS